MVEQAAAELEHGAAAESGVDAGDEIRLDARYRLAYQSPLPEFRSPRAPAYLAYDDRFTTRGLFALILEPDLPYRGDVLSSLTGQPAQNWLDVAWAGVFTEPGTGARRIAAVLERPDGGRLWSAASSPAPPFSEPEITKRVVPALATALTDLEQRHIVHGAIRPDNLFYVDKDRLRLALGECFSEPAGLSQPVAFEPIERSLAMPLGRGEGTAASDLYSLGVTVLALLRGNDPAAGCDDELLRRKLVEGSYAAMVDDNLISNAIRTLLKGLLNDDPEIRWTPKEVAEWCKSPRVNPRRTPRPRRAPRPIGFGSKEYYYAPVLAMDLSQEVREAKKAIGDGKLENWLRRELHDAAAADMVAYALTRGKASDEELVARTCIALDPRGPLRFKDLAVRPEGLGPVLADAFAGNDTVKLQALANLLAGPLPALWVEAQALSPQQVVSQLRSLAEAQAQVREQAPGFGLERCLYELNPSLPCRSPLVAANFILNLRDLLVALDNAVAGGVEGDNLLDRHIAAFIASRRPQSVSVLRHLGPVGKDEGEKLLASLAVLAELQRREPGLALPNLSAWLIQRLEPVIDTFHSRIRREVISKNLQSISADGNLIKIEALVDSAGARQRDDAEFAQAQQEYSANQRQIKLLENAGGVQSEAAARYGHRIAAGVGVAVLILTVGYLAAMGTP